MSTFAILMSHVDPDAPDELMQVATRKTLLGAQRFVETKTNAKVYWYFSRPPCYERGEVKRLECELRKCKIRIVEYAI